MNHKPVVTRYAPSPTGTWHLGQARTALFAYLFAKKHGGKFILRIDDTDKERSKKEYEEAIFENLEWLGLGHDELHRQSERADLHRRELERMIAEGSAYVSQEKVEKEGDRPEVIRFRNPNERIAFHDLIRGDIEFDTTELGDFVIAKDLDTPLYHLASVIDDADMEVTHIIRGEDHISNTPRQILLFRALGASEPEFAHLPLLLAPDRSKLSKRRGAKPLSDYRNDGYLPQAILNYTALLGWSPQSSAGGQATDQEIFSLDELVGQFEIRAVQKSGAVFNQEKLDWFNREYIKRLSDEEFLNLAATYKPESISEKAFAKLAPVLKERITCFGEIGRIFESGEFDFFISKPDYDKTTLKTQEHLAAVKELVSRIPEEEFSPEAVKAAVWDYATEKGRGEVLWPFRIALTGKERSPDPFTVAGVIGKEETLARIDHAQNL